MMRVQLPQGFIQIFQQTFRRYITYAWKWAKTVPGSIELGNDLISEISSSGVKNLSINQGCSYFVGALYQTSSDLASQITLAIEYVLYPFSLQVRAQLLLEGNGLKSVACPPCFPLSCSIHLSSVVVEGFLQQPTSHQVVLRELETHLIITHVYSLSLQKFGVLRSICSGLGRFMRRVISFITPFSSVPQIFSKPETSKVKGKSYLHILPSQRKSGQF